MHNLVFPLFKNHAIDNLKRNRGNKYKKKPKTKPCYRPMERWVGLLQRKGKRRHMITLSEHKQLALMSESRSRLSRREIN